MHRRCPRAITLRVNRCYAEGLKYTGGGFPTFSLGRKGMLPSPVTDLKAFVPSKDLDVSLAFYRDLGFTVNWSNDQIAELQMGGFRFLLQKFYVAQHAGNFMMSLAVEDADAWWKHIEQQQFTSKYPGITCKPPAMQPWGLRVLYLSDPTGVLWHIAENPKS
jgi:catechol 2,3-dioxygenase-like lactoylglutathione lyase family enzyme